MIDHRILITGAHSYLGSRVTQYLLSKSNYDIYALVTPWSEGLNQGTESGRLHYLRYDLTQPFSPEIKALLASVGHVFHFAWVRGHNLQRVTELNENIIDSLMEPMSDPSRFYFFSSVGAAPGASSTYGLAKWNAMNLVRAKGGSVLVCGLVVDLEPKGPFKMLCTFVEKLPISLRSADGEPRIYPVHINDVLACVQHTVEINPSPGNYKIFITGGLDFNQFLAKLEERYPKTRIKITLNLQYILRSVALIKRSRLAPQGLSDRILTFLYKDDDYLRSHNEIPGINLKELSNDFSVKIQ